MITRPGRRFVGSGVGDAGPPRRQAGCVPPESGLRGPTVVGHDPGRPSSAPLAREAGPRTSRRRRPLPRWSARGSACGARRGTQRKLVSSRGLRLGACVEAAERLGVGPPRPGGSCSWCSRISGVAARRSGSVAGFPYPGSGTLWRVRRGSTSVGVAFVTAVSPDIHCFRGPFRRAPRARRRPGGDRWRAPQPCRAGRQPGRPAGPVVRSRRRVVLAMIKG